MRYQLMFEGRAVAQSEYRDLAEATAATSPVPVTLVDSWSGKQLPVPARESADYRLPDQTLYQLITVEQRKIFAIKLIREITGWGLAESKAYADRIG